MKTKISGLGNDCCGCSACIQRCPKHCISLQEDSEGFLYPHVDEDSCISCVACEKACPALNPQDKIAPRQVLAAKNRDERERMDSSSGGVFLPLARKVINNGGVVFGAVYDEAWEVRHVHTETTDGLRPMMCSKYLQSRIENTYQEAETFLRQGREVMYVGSPCQIAGLMGFLRHKDYPNLLTVDFLCHGAPSPGVWRRYLAERYGGFRQTAAQRDSGKETPDVGNDRVAGIRAFNSRLPIGYINFRDKTESGWGKYHIVVTRKSAGGKDNARWTSDVFSKNPYMRGFLTDIYMRPSCYACKCKNGASHSDMTIGDFWGIGSAAPEFDDDKGVGLVLVNSPKGEDYFDRLDMETLPSTLESASKNNGGFKENTKAHPKRKLFFEMFGKGESVETAVGACLRVSVSRMLIGKVKRVIKRLIR